MKSTKQLFSIVFFLTIIPSFLYAQASADNLINKEMEFHLKNDTLFSDTGLKLFAGQQLIVGNAAGASGIYRSIISKKAAIVPSIWGKDARYENAIENYVDSKKNKEKVKASLIPGNLLTIKKISLSKTGKPHFYLISLVSDTDAYNCDIKLALLLNELLIEINTTK